MTCSKCDAEHYVKNGVHHGRQRYKCKGCGYQFTLSKPRGKGLEQKCLAVML